MRITQRLTLLLLLIGVLTRCDGSTTCESCTATATGLTLFAPAHVSASACVPVQIVAGDGKTPARFDSTARIDLEGKASWSTSASCSLSAKTATASANTRGAIAYVRAGSPGTLTPMASLADARGNTSIVVEEPAADPSALVLTGTRFTDAGECVPFWLGAVNAGGHAAKANVDVTLSGVSGARTFGDEGCTSSLDSVRLDGAGRVIFVRFALPGPGVVTAAASGLGSSETNVDVQGTAQRRLAFAPDSAPVSTQAGVCTAVGVVITDVTGAPFIVDNVTLDATVSGDAGLFRDNGCTEAATSVAITNTNAATFYVLGTRVGDVALSVVLDGVAIEKTVTITNGPAALLDLSGTTRLTATGCYPQTVSVQDAYGNAAVGGAHTIGLTATGAATFRDSGCTIAAAQVTASADTANAAFWIRGTAATETASVTATLSGVFSVKHDLRIVAPATQLRLVAAATARAGDCTSVDVRALDADGNRADVLAAESAAFSTSGGALARYADSGCVTPMTSYRIPALQDHTTAYVRATVPGSFTINAAGSNLTSAPPASLVVSAGLPAILVGSAPVVANVAACSKVTVTLTDAFGNVTTADGAHAVSFTTSGTGSFFADNTCTTPSSSRTFATGDAQVRLFYLSPAIENSVVTAASTGLRSVTVALPTDVLANRVVADVSNVPIAREVEIDPSTPATMWLALTNNATYVSTDSGATWSARCLAAASTSAGPDVYGTIVVSPAADHTAYLTGSYLTYRLDAMSGAVCPPVSSTLGTLYSYSETSGFTIGENGTLYAWAGSPIKLNRSTDRGATWTAIYNDTQSTAWMGFMATSPGAGTIKLVDRAFAGTNGGLYRSTDGGSTFTFVTATGFDDLTNKLRFDPAHTGFVYKSGRHSEDSGLTWTTYPSLSLSWNLDSAGALYRFDTSAADKTVVQRAPDARAPVFANLPASAFTESFDNNSSHLSVSPDGTRIAVQTGGALYLSTNSGTSFSRVPMPNDPGALTTMNVVAVDDNVAYAVGSRWLTFSTIDGGVTWTYRLNGDSTESAFVHVNPSFPQAAYIRAESFNSTYDQTLIATQDAFATPVKNKNGSGYGWATVAAVSLSDPKAYVGLGYFSCVRSLDGGKTTTTFACAFPNVWYPSPVAWIHPTNSNVVWYVGGTNSAPYTSTLNAYDMSANTVTDRTSITGLTTAPGAIEMYQTGASAYVVRVAGADGSLVTSTNLMASFGSKSAASGDGTCTQRVLTSLASNHQVVATGCIGGTSYGVSKDGGATWRIVRPATCTLCQLSLTSGASIATCEQGTSKATLL